VQQGVWNSNKEEGWKEEEWKEEELRSKSKVRD
jgi:hypothetical protein